MAVQIQTRRDTAANWTANDPTLAEGEIGFETDTGKIKVGDDSTAWTALDYIDSAIDHDALTNFEVNEHFTEASIDHSAITNLDYASAGHTGFATSAQGALADSALQAETDPVFLALSGPFLTAETDPVFLALSGPWNTHIADNTQAHSDYLLNSGSDSAVGPIDITADLDLSGVKTIRNILIGTEATPGPANLYPQGTIYLKYTA